ncbi:sigma-70 family rna polymerase sigma factor : RNA polymerase sigma factor, sigma-70 family OS=Singulisphaera acidiphila (strain ATCC BAA-1392 / DSM 18658 / VKM B-2454 / MOB10) GN=Sinac_7487 PE=4 SV=1: Sigma70_r2: Sigma70_r4_2 [Gemmata massiliana]|uniref:RNA polymerase sigma-70 region 2 domain-containing protein n=1 Tax=Gemmata massiliana TaxID=1210884 RepID=A0A6P2D1E6_9BACT|nr:sigma-70 family RNA polymerase sigma factor [Gemmata massiliana]VTR94949.1 sigma-70 family rna polymerase sigma factor : RNA polymerase sigma factor, sigma-70 family OS=Singulisphaera acidiphila (strain ATCC BAA-1392 / DSM 18658 / VKM B-2454 / MOB10) GN=Sinac_7487 PE=4 SV=1: Sigma70_r2: Sigma70_r4_2 [Gemmata massiliana]
MNQHLHAIRRATAEAMQTDGQLLDAYSDHRDGAAFAELVRRHGPMVWGVCRRMLPNRQDAEDAFQATFLVLVRKSASVRPAERVGNWLHGVAVRAAQKAAVSARRRERSVEGVADPAVVESGAWRDVLPILDEELSLLPDKYRSVIVLCDLEQMTRTAAARRLGVPEGTVAGWLARARALLGNRLARRGVGTPALAALISERVVSALVPAPLVRTTIEAANQAGPTPTGVATLTEGVIRTMFLKKIRSAAIAVLVALGVVASGAVLLTRPTVAAQPARTEATGLVKLVERPAANPPENCAHVDRSLEPSAARYRALFERALYVLVEHFGQITSANAYEGRIETRQQFGNRTAVVTIRAAEEGGGYLVEVRILHEVPGVPAFPDADLERVVLRQLAPQTEIRSGDRAIPTVRTGATVSSSPQQIEARPDPTTPRVQKPVESEDDQVRRLQKEVDELRERVRALERRPSNRENGVSPSAKDGR